MPHICSHKHVVHLENPLRRMLHQPERIYAPWVRPGMRILDIGCGGGFAAIPMARITGPKGVVFAADLQPEMLNRMLSRARREGVADLIFPHLCQADRIGTEGRFDFINAFWMLHEVPDIPTHLEEIRSLIRPNGRFFLSEPCFHVTAKAFAKEHEAVLAKGFRELARPRILMGRARVYAPA
ncbi:class I SAM-dependent methyltransferase [Desulfobotulus sp. H1]|uniref:Class I SAM-dependent methyltransferase n=1 Tax=Desulfobotulus pelophilus TaxID=2823377 RepID=A0ABT3N7P3_9BACT|nr:methyltransferase domain-containing protein [Desulfobotulus pelophilus]MCW7753475.1 class I SAM-dependent methyltransferase [Desulfobotulus pelophilus]